MPIDVLASQLPLLDDADDLPSADSRELIDVLGSLDNALWLVTIVNMRFRCARSIEVR